MLAHARPYQPAFKPEKFRELLLYIASESTDDPTFGAVKINKVLYYADFAAFRQFGKPITGATYRKLDEGPAPLEMLAERRALIESGEAEVQKSVYFTGVQHRLVAKRASDREVFEPGEVDIVNQVMAFFHGKTAREVSDYSHREPGWKLAKPLEDIPYDTAWLSSEPFTQEEEEFARSVVQSL